MYLNKMTTFNPIKTQIDKIGDHVEIINGDHPTNIKIFFTDSTKDDAYRISKRW